MILRNRRDEGMDVGKHDVTLEKSRRLGAGVVAPLTQTLKKQLKKPLDSEPQIPVEEPSVERREYKSVLDAETNKEKQVGITYKNSKLGANKKINRLFPAYGCPENKWKSTKTSMEVQEEPAVVECQYRSKQFFKQKYEQKDFIEVLLRARVNPNKRDGK